MPYQRRPEKVGDFLRGVLPQAVSRRLLPPGFEEVWSRAVGEAIARRARPICVGRDGRLVVAVEGASWRQELSLLAPQISQKLAREGYDLELKLVAASGKGRS